MDCRRLLLCTALISIAAAQIHVLAPGILKPAITNVLKLRNAVNSFGSRLFDQLTTYERRNVFICPFSVATSISILYQGAGGETKKELADALGYTEANITSDEVAQAIYLYTTKFLVSYNPNTYTYSAPATILINRRNSVLQSFQRVMEILYQTPISIADFYNSRALADNINEWISIRTDNKINNIIDDIDPFADLILVNAAHFKGRWMYTLSPDDTHNENFFNHGIEPKKVPMMHMIHVLPYHVNDKRSVLELPFRGGNFSMIIFLPIEYKGLNKLENELSPENFLETISKLQALEVRVALPKFKLQYKENLVRSLLDMGIGDIFDPHFADLSRMLHQGSAPIGDIYHKTTVSVNEAGLEEASLTVTRNMKSIIPDDIIKFEVNHPFLFVINDRRTDMIVFIGRVSEL